MSLRMRIVAAYFISFLLRQLLLIKLDLQINTMKLIFLILKKEAATNRAAVRVRIYLSFLSLRVITKMART